MIFLLFEIDHPELFDSEGIPEADHIKACQHFLLEEILFKNGVHWMKRTPRGLLSAFEGGDAPGKIQGRPAEAAIAIQKDFQGHLWDRFGKGKVRVVLHAGEAEKFGQTYVGPDVTHARKLLDAAYGGQILMTVPAVHHIPLPPGARLLDLGVHTLKDLSDPQTIYSLQHPELSQAEQPPLRSFETYRHNLIPQKTAFFGREDEIREIRELLTHSQTRLATLVGPGGFGKTRLALQAAADMVEKFKDGVYLVSLAPLLMGELMVGSIANTIKFYFFGPEEPKTQLLHHLREKEMLLILDNFEHIIEGSDLVKEMLDAAPNLRVLITSREGLRITGEKIYEVRGLRYPARGQTLEMEASPAVQLFLKNARRIRPDFSLKNEDRDSLLQICQLLEGMPLGLELSASWVASLSLKEIADKIESSRDFLATTMPHLPPRHRSLRAVFEYSWILLNPSQKEVLKDIATFKGGFDAAAARKVAGASPVMLDYLENKSLLRKRSDQRYEIHELLKFYAKEKLFDDPVGKEKAFDAHSLYYSQVVYHLGKKLYGTGQQKALAQLVLDRENILEGWKRAVEFRREREIGDYLDGLFGIFDTKGWFQEAREAFQGAAESLREKYGRAIPTAKSKVLLARILARWAAFENGMGQARKARHLLEESLELFKSANAPLQSGFALSCMGVALESTGDYAGARRHYEKSLQVYQRLKDRPGIAWALNNLGHISLRTDDYARAQKLIRQSLAYSESHGDRRAAAYSNNLLGDVLRELGMAEEAKAHYQKGLSNYLESGDRRGVAWSFSNLGTMAEKVGDYAGARQMYLEGMAISRDLGDRRALAWAKGLMGITAWDIGDYKEALQLYEEGLSLYREAGDARGEAWCLDLAGNVHLAQGEDQEAEKNYTHAFSLLIKEGVNLQNIAWNFYHLGAVSISRKRYAEADERFHKALGYFHKSRDTVGQVGTLIQLGEIACANKDFSAAEKYFREAVPLALRAAARPQLVDLLAGLARLKKAQGEESKAIGFLMVALNHPTCRQQTK
ncbi:MAG TPA: tetratricopeptide repeat protein, partial [bacterium]|nr:tetratricopeptide repeat protein [bacterium]